MTLVAVVLSAFVLSSCKTDLLVEVQANTAGTGNLTLVATLDRDAAAALGDPQTSLATADLKAAGWTVSTLPSESGLVVTVGHPFRSTAEANQLFSSLSGANGPLKGLVLTRSNRIFNRAINLSGTADLTNGLQTFGDQALATVAQSPSLVGITDDEIARQSGKPVAEVFSFAVSADLGNGKTQTWTVPLGAVEPIVINNTQLVWPAIAGLLAALGGVGLLLWMLIDSRGSKRSPTLHGQR